FIEDAVPGDVLDVKILRKKKGYYQGVPHHFVKYSPARQEPACSHFIDCGGCKWQHFRYENQLFEKEKIVREAFARIGKVDVEQVDKILPAPAEYHYRNKMEFSFSNQRWKTKLEILNDKPISEEVALGLHPPGFFNKVVDLQQCLLMSQPADDIRNFIRDYALRKNLSFYDPVRHTGFLRNMILRNSTLGEWMLVMSFGYEDEVERKDLLNAVTEQFPSITSLNYAINEKKNDTLFDQHIICYKGAESIREKLGDLVFRIRPKSFFQTNSLQAHRLYQVVRKFADLNQEDIVYDLYTGTGSIALFVASDCKEIIGVEEIYDAISDAKENAKNNGIHNAHFYVGDVKNVFTEDLLNRHGRPDVVITDPPRGGMNEKVVVSILNAKPRKVVYISCNPATQARDIAILAAQYRVLQIQPVDMFPHTSHIENVALLMRRDEK
ncbi:MAG: 23S rRNA (uracil(1939)-C(5))-methyltransferase RlmD, partial [Saprospiraceae bacterium]|nr:23S rRNA (uracil(1939)-C(5))-methyltransferase RlmD [Saprospiraceae bacterium]